MTTDFCDFGCGCSCNHHRQSRRTDGGVTPSSYKERTVVGGECAHYGSKEEKELARKDSMGTLILSCKHRDVTVNEPIH